MNIKFNVDSHRFCNILDSCRLTRRVNSTTGKGGHTVDLVISRESSPSIVGAPPVCDPCLSVNRSKSFGEHLAVQFVINMDKPGYMCRKIAHRKFRGINIKHLSKWDGSVN